MITKKMGHLKKVKLITLSTTKRKVFSTLIVLTLLYIVYQTIYMLDIPRKYYQYDLSCKIPYFDAFDPSMTQFVHRIPELRCGYKPPLIISNLTHFKVDEKAINFYDIDNMNELDCLYREFKRVDEETEKEAYQIKYFRFKNMYNQVMKARSEFVRVNCRAHDREIYKDYHFFVPLKNNGSKVRKLKNRMNVIIVGLGSLSRLNLHRQMPKTLKMLYKMNAIEMTGFNTLGYTSYANVIAMLTGYTEEELKNNCFRKGEDYLDDCPFIWKLFREHGYITSFAEEDSGYGIFQHNSGFKKQPTDYYGEVGMNEAEKEIGHKKLDHYIDSPNLCFGVRPKFQVLLDYAVKFFLSLKTTNYFSVFWQNSLTKHHLNHASLGDEAYETFLKKVSHNSIFYNSIVFFVSDHGMLWNDVMLTYQGYMEARMPALFILLPSEFRKKYKYATTFMEENVNALTSPFDIYKTLKDILILDKLEDEKLLQRIGNDMKYRGISLFLPIPQSRSCASSGISDFYCVCHQFDDIYFKDKLVFKAAHFLLNNINLLLLKAPQCAEFKLGAIVEAKNLKGIFANTEYLRDYIITINVIPGNFDFIGTVRCENCKSKDNFRILGHIKRIGYFENPTCTSLKHLYPYCFCN